MHANSLWENINIGWEYKFTFCYIHKLIPKLSGVCYAVTSMLNISISDIHK
jgi:hypothetical protein